MNFTKQSIQDKQNALTSKKNKVKKKLGVTILKISLFTVLILVLFIGCAGFGVVKGIIDSAPDIAYIDVSPSAYETVIVDSEGNEIDTLVTSGSNRSRVEIQDIPKYLQDAFVAIEDIRFYSHNGIDITGIMRAASRALTTGNFSEGASTITQQLLKNNVFQNWTEQSYLPEKVKRKIQEQYLAVQLEKTMDKSEILEEYLNTINLGQNTLGVQAAAKRYFNKNVSDLTLSECAVIAAITQNPSSLNPISHPENNKKRRKKVLDNMLEANFISKEEYDTAMADDIYSRIQDINNEVAESSPYTYFVDELVEQCMNDLQEQKGYSYQQAYNLLYSGGLTIYSTQDTAIQQICDEEFQDEKNFPAGTRVSITYFLTVEHADGKTEHYNESTLRKHYAETDSNYKLIYGSQEKAQAAVDEYKAAVLKEGDTVTYENLFFTPQPQASFTIMDQHTGEVKAIVGGRGVKEASLTLNRATNTARQPGSTFKVVSTYAPALDNAGLTLATVQNDSSYAYANGKPVNNYDKRYRGLTTIREGIRDSINIVAVKTLTQISPKLGYDYLQNFEFSTLSEKDIVQSLALGGVTKGVTNLELNASYATIANGGTYIAPRFYTKIVDQQGNVVIENEPVTKTVLKDSTAYLLTNAMEGVVNEGTGSGVKFEGMPIAGKTGTTSSSYDIWFVGFTPYYTAAIWGGYDVNTTIDSSFHKALWKKIMSRVHSGLERKEFEIPESVETATICTKSGKLAVNGLCDAAPGGSTVREEFFAKGTVPTEPCDCHTSITICQESGQIASDNCPASSRKTDIYIIKPADTQGTTEDTPYYLPDNITDKVCTIHGKGSSGSTENPQGGDSSENSNKPAGSAENSNKATGSQENQSGQNNGNAGN